MARAAELGLGEIGFSDHLVPRACDERGLRPAAIRLDELRGRRAPGARRAPACASCSASRSTTCRGAEDEMEALLARRALRLRDRLGALRRRVRLRHAGAQDDPAGDDVDALYRRVLGDGGRRRGDGAGSTSSATSTCRRSSATGRPRRRDGGRGRGARGDPRRRPGDRAQHVRAGGSAAARPTRARRCWRAPPRSASRSTFGSDAHRRRRRQRLRRAAALARAAGYAATLRLSDGRAEALP